MPSEAFVNYMNQGATAFANGDYTNAGIAFAQALQTDPSSIDARLAYAITLFALGDYRAAAEPIRQVIPQYSEVVYSDFDLRERYGKKEQLDKQLAVLRAFVKANPDDVDAMIVLGFIEHFSGNRDSAKEVFRKALTLSPNDSVAATFLNPPPLVPPTTQPAGQTPTTRPALPSASDAESRTMQSPTTRPASAADGEQTAI